METHASETYRCRVEVETRHSGGGRGVGGGYSTELVVSLTSSKDSSPEPPPGASDVRFMRDDDVAPDSPMPPPCRLHTHAPRISTRTPHTTHPQHIECFASRLSTQTRRVFTWTVSEILKLHPSEYNRNAVIELLRHTHIDFSLHSKLVLR